MALEEEHKPKLPTHDEQSRDSFPTLPKPASEHKQEPLPSPVNSPIGLVTVKNELKGNDQRQDPGVQMESNNKIDNIPKTKRRQ